MESAKKKRTISKIKKLIEKINKKETQRKALVELMRLDQEMGLYN